MNYLLSATIFLQTEPVGVPSWVPILIVIILLLLFLWGMTRNNIPQGEPLHADDHHDDHHDEGDALVETAVSTHAITETRTEHTAVVESVEPDDLKKIEGIGPKIEGILHEAGIRTFAALAAASVDQLEKIVREDAGIRIAFPDTWPQQAKLAAAGDWASLEKLQDELKGGRQA